MPWFYVDDTLHSHPKPRRAGLAPIGLWTLAGSYSMAYKTDGFVPHSYVTSWPRGRTHAQQLVDAGLWIEVTEHGEHGWRFKDFRGRHGDDRHLHPWQRQAIIERDGHICQLCGSEVDPADIHIDHIHPRSKGGTDLPHNLQVTHSRCNLRKAARVSWPG